MKKIIKSEEEWKNLLTEEEFLITRKKGTEPAFSGKEFNIINEGSFLCKCCNAIYLIALQNLTLDVVGLVFMSKSLLRQ